MKKDITPEMYNYNKFPGPTFERTFDRIQAEGIDLRIVDNYKEAFDLTAFEQRFTTFMLKFDYIVGDWGNEQLRLKGFYKDDRTNKLDLKISRLEDYLLEYCNYGCAYFVLENPTPQEPLKEDEQDLKINRRRRKSRSNRQNQSVSSRTEEQSYQVSGKYQANQLASGNVKKSRRRTNQTKTEKRSFEIKREKTSSEKKPVKKNTPSTKREFVIRQK
ncbi:YutD family protein [Streptococcus ovuberis]|uniref:DUF1027 domain-containing protein n=1 Tax=Streptococcus ovuberis TaxID=1936207 RepID=A0A7X6S1Q0_9STRE|nr:YutD-like domain-containing protein [Streptococcus ovuberis]NKZ20386.1 DUF1027 domain-containing protein [Streptococcus ovuberis]